MSKIDFKKEMKSFYNPSKKDFIVVDVPEMQFLMVTGHGDTNMVEEYKQAIEALYAIAYKIKFMSKIELDKDYVVPPLEGLWWAEDMESFTTHRDKSKWDWTMMIMQPDWITEAIYEEGKMKAGKKELPSLEKVTFEKYHEGLTVQIMHVGSYDEEAPTLERLHSKWMPENGYTFDGKHHEIYLSDPRKVEAAKLKTVLRQPVKSL